VSQSDLVPLVLIVLIRFLEINFSAVPEWAAAAAFGLVTVITLLLRNVPVLQDNLLYEVSLPFIHHFDSTNLVLLNCSFLYTI
jgi:hypothetical protein